MTTSNSAEFPYASHFEMVNGSRIHYVKEGVGDPILLLHGVPTSSYLWRNIIPHLATLGCCIAPDLIGMGQSDKPNINYTIFDHIDYIEKFVKQLNLTNLTLVLHGWGSLIGFDFAMRHESQCKALIFYEAYLRAMNGEDISLPLDEQIHLLDQEENIYDLVLNSTYYIDKFFPQEMMHTLTPAELNKYREPFLQKGSGKVLQQYLKELPRRDRQCKVNELIDCYSKKLMQSNLPKLLLYSVPGFITTIAAAIWAKEHLPNLEVIDIGEEFHFAQESNPIVMGEAMSVWLQGIEQRM